MTGGEMLAFYLLFCPRRPSSRSLFAWRKVSAKCFVIQHFCPENNGKSKGNRSKIRISLYASSYTVPYRTLHVYRLFYSINIFHFHKNSDIKYKKHSNKIKRFFCARVFIHSFAFSGEHGCCFSHCLCEFLDTFRGGVCEKKGILEFRENYLDNINGNERRTRHSKV